MPSDSAVVVSSLPVSVSFADSAEAVAAVLVSDLAPSAFLVASAGATAPASAVLAPVLASSLAWVSAMSSWAWVWDLFR